MAAKKAVVEVPKFRCGCDKTEENTTNQGKCRYHRDLRARQYRADNPEKAREYSRKSMSKAEAEGKLARYRQDNRKVLTERQRNWRSALTDEQLAAQRAAEREAARRYYWRNREAILQKQRLKNAEARVAKHNEGYAVK